MKVFISHARQDNPLAKKLATELRGAGLDVWSADDEIYPGDNWAKMIGEALEQFDAMVAVASRGTLESGPLNDDVQFALTSKNYQGRVIPVLVGMTSLQAGNDVPWILLRLNPVYIESASSSFHDVVERVRSLAEMHPMPTEVFLSHSSEDSALAGRVISAHCK